jgi:hypothetical protein
MPAFNTFVKQIEINSGGGVRITIFLQTIFDNGDVHNHPHQLMIDTTWGDDIVQRAIDGNNAHINAMGYPSIRSEEIEWPLSLRGHAHSLPLVAERRQIEFELKAQQEKDLADRANGMKEVAELNKRAIEDMVAAAVTAAVSKGG